MFAPQSSHVIVFLLPLGHTLPPMLRRACSSTCHSVGHFSHRFAGLSLTSSSLSFPHFSFSPSAELLSFLIIYLSSSHNSYPSRSLPALQTYHHYLLQRLCFFLNPLSLSYFNGLLPASPGLPPPSTTYRLAPGGPPQTSLH